mmetsp:Transcript_2248/g.2491  ORF Transcript_2248/g.2491 Transcript_2248/m.2491 type:complete len:448 (+) Transcript_2248:184-1527(+)
MPRLLPSRSRPGKSGGRFPISFQQSLLLLLLLPSFGTFILPSFTRFPSLGSRKGSVARRDAEALARSFDALDRQVSLEEDPDEEVDDGYSSSFEQSAEVQTITREQSLDEGSTNADIEVELALSSSRDDGEAISSEEEEVVEESNAVVTNCAVGIAKGLKKEGIFTFVESLLSTTMNVHIYLYVDKIPEGMTNTSEIRFIIFDQDELPKPWGRFHPSSYRYYIYHEFMKHTGYKYNKVQASDIRDIAFQTDPFDTVKDGEDTVHIFEEDSSMNIGKCWVNSNWISACYGHSLLGRIRPRPISCSGYAIGTPDAMRRYFEAMAGEIGTNLHCEQNGIDQGVHNVLVNHGQAQWQPSKGNHYSPLPTFTSHTNEAGPVFTGGYAEKGNYNQDENGDFKNKVDVLYSVLHQYDRHDYMTPLLEAKAKSAKAARLEREANLALTSRGRAGT